MTRRTIRAWTCVLAAMLACLAAAPPAPAAEYQTAAAGGGGGNPFTLRCPNDSVLVGLEGRAEAFLDQVTLVCRQVDPLGRWVGGSHGGSAGGTGGKPFPVVFECPTNQAISGIDGRAGTVVDQLRIKCGPLTAGPRLAASGSLLPRHVGGTGGNPFGPFDCVDDKPGRGLAGRAGIYLDQVRLICDYPPAPLEPVSFFAVLPGNLLSQVVRTAGGLLLQMRLSSPWDRGDFRVPVRNSNPSVAVIAGPPGEGTMLHLSGADASTAVFEMSPRGVGCTRFDVGYSGRPALAAVHVLVEKPQSAGLSLALNVVEWTATTTGAFGTITLPGPAPAGGTAVALTSSPTGLALVPASVTVPQGTRTTTFEIHRVASAAGCVVVTANGNGGSVQSVMLFDPLPGKIFTPPTLQSPRVPKR